jgi:hypothetical protein
MQNGNHYDAIVIGGGPALAAGDVSSERFREYGSQLCEGIEAMRKVVYSFYNATFSNLFRDFDPLFGAMAKFADIPKPVPHGTPLVMERAALEQCP